MSKPESSRVFYRLIRAETPEPFDFLPHRAQGRRLRTQSDYEFWARGVSVFSRPDAARRMSRVITPELPYMVRLVIPPGSALHIEPTRGRHHYTIWDADPIELMRYIDGPAEPV